MNVRNEDIDAVGAVVATEEGKARELSEVDTKFQDLHWRKYLNILKAGAFDEVIKYV